MLVLDYISSIQACIRDLPASGSHAAKGGLYSELAAAFSLACNQLARPGGEGAAAAGEPRVRRPPACRGGAASVFAWEWHCPAHPCRPSGRR